MPKKKTPSKIVKKAEVKKTDVPKKPFKLWEKGVSGNPKGRPKGAKNRSTLIKIFSDVKIGKIPYLAARFPNLVELTLEEALGLKLFEAGLNMEVGAIREVMDTLYGKITDKTEITGADGGPVQISEVEITFVRPK
jgi:Family of unknown function (DUF5681)